MQEKSRRAEKIKEMLVVDEEKILEELLRKARKFIALTKDGKVYFQVERTRIPKLFQVALYLVAKKFAYEAGIRQSESVTIEEISRDLGETEKMISAMLSELLSRGLIDMIERGVYSVSLPQIQLILSEVEQKMSKE